jgi:RNA recognition motif-containing protein
MFAFMWGWATVATEADAEAVIRSMNGHLILGRALVVNLARPREERPDRRRAGGGRPDRREHPTPYRVGRSPLRSV